MSDDLGLLLYHAALSADPASRCFRSHTSTRSCGTCSAWCIWNVASHLDWSLRSTYGTTKDRCGRPFHHYHTDQTRARHWNNHLFGLFPSSILNFTHYHYDNHASYSLASHSWILSSVCCFSFLYPLTRGPDNLPSWNSVLGTFSKQAIWPSVRPADSLDSPLLSVPHLNLGQATRTSRSDW